MVREDRREGREDLRLEPTVFGLRPSTPRRETSRIA